MHDRPEAELKSAFFSLEFRAIMFRAWFTPVFFGVLAVSTPNTVNADPNGSYKMTCRYCSIQRNGMLSCSCRKIDQSYQSSAISTRSCAREEVENIDGTLKCVAPAAMQSAEIGENPDEGAENDDGSELPMRATPPIETPKPAPPPVRYRALAAGIHEGFMNNHASVASSGTRSTRAEAENDAVQSCMDAANVAECHVISTFTGCGYITSGSNGNQVGFGSGPTAQDAYNNCTARGLSCKEPLGGCTD